MELIVISKSKLKIMLTGEDMSRYAIDCNTLDYENTETRRAFWSILDEAKHRTGFDAASEKVFVQVYPSKGGGCEMYVTKLGAFGSDRSYDEDEEDSDISIASERGRKNMKKSAYKAPLSEGAELSLSAREYAFRFNCIEKMLSACRRLTDIGFSGSSSALKGPSEYYLVIDEKRNVSNGGFLPCELLSEYGERVGIEILKIGTGEHFTYICEKNAVGILSVL